MPGRVSVRSQRSSVPVKSTAQTPKSRAPAATRSSSHAVQIPDEGDSTSLRTHICNIFADAQRSTAGHRKLAVSLRKTQEACCYEPTKPRKQVREEFGEEQFNAEIGRCVIRLLPVKKSEGVGDRTVRFLGLFLKHAADADNAIFQNSEQDHSQTYPETPTSRLTTHVISLLLSVLSAKDKFVRYRATQIIAYLINTLDSIDDELFHRVRVGLLKRLRDKESIVRVQAVHGLGRLAGEPDDGHDDEESDDESTGGVLDKLLDILQNDPSAEVRRSLLLNLPFTPTTLPFLLERARDLDSATRRALYSRLLPALGDFRHLSLTHREKLLRWGLRDRDENVRKATARLFRERWIDDCARPRELAEGGEASAVQRDAAPSMDALMELLERIDVVNSGVEGGIALEAMKEFWDGRPDYREIVVFDDTFWNQPSPESIFIARTFNDYCRQEENARLQEIAADKLPEVTKIAFLLQRHTNILVDSIRTGALQENQDAEEDTVQQEFVVEQLLHVALTLDYTDEIGRRKMFSLMREALALAELPEESTKLVVEVLRTVCGNDAAGEREFCGVVLEAVAEVHDTIMGEESAEQDGDESFHSARSELSEELTPTQAKKTKSKRDSEGTEEEEGVDDEKAIREIMVNMKCLHIAQCMLQNVHCELEQNVHLVTMLNNLVVPAVRSQEAPIRERGLLCLGLCCLLGKSLAEENLTLFLHCFNKGHDALQQISIQIISDILTTHPSLLAPSSPAPNASPRKSTTNNDPTEPNPLQKPINKMFTKALKSPVLDVQASACTALCKLLLSNIIHDDDLLRQLVIAYFDPDTQGNAALRQALSYSLPVYCHSRKENMERMGRIAVGAVHALMGVAEEMMEEEGEMVGMGVVGAHLVEWTDGRKVVGVGGQDGAGEGDVHLGLAEDLLEKVLTPGTSKEEKKVYFSMLSKLYITTSSNLNRLRTVLELVEEAIGNKVASDATSRNVLNKLHTSLGKIVKEKPGVGEGREEEGPRTGVVETVEGGGEGGEGGEGSVVQGAEETVVEGGVDDTRYEPDAEGTVFGDRDRDEEVDDDDEDDGHGDTIVVGYGTEVGRADGLQGSCVDTLLDD